MRLRVRAAISIPTIGVGVWVFTASQGCAAMGDACRNTGSVLGFFWAVMMIICGVGVILGVGMNQRR